jgi:hypothetical protein
MDKTMTSGSSRLNLWVDGVDFGRDRGANARSLFELIGDCVCNEEHV